MQKINKSHVFTIGLFLAILPYLYLSFFANPCADDFVFAHLFQTQDFVNLVKHNYFRWNGRYISNALIYLNPIAFNSFFGYKLVPITIIFLSLLVNMFFIKSLFFRTSKIKHLIVSLILSLLFFHNMPIISEGIYWFTGAVIYHLGVIVSLFYITCLIRTIQKARKKTALIGLIFLLFITCGFNEVLTLLIVFFLALTSYIFYKKDLIGKKIVITQFLFSIIFAAILVFSPGNVFRESTYQNTHWFSYSLSYSILQVGRFLLNWTASVPLILASILYLRINKELKEDYKHFKNSFYLNRWLSLFMLLAIIFICVFPAYWTTGMLGQHRTLNVAYFFFIIMWFINLTVWFNYYQHKLFFTLSHKIVAILSVFLLIGIMFTGNGYNGLNDTFSGKAKQYNIQLNKRFKLLQAAKSTTKKALILPKLTAFPICLFVSDITEQPNYWTNQAYNLYFRMEEKQILIRKN